MMNTTTTLNTTLNALINATFTYKKKVNGETTEISTTMLSEGFKKMPSAKNCPTLSEEGKKVLNALEKAYEWAERHGTATTVYQRNKCAENKHQHIKEFLKLVGMDTGIGNVEAIGNAIAFKCQTYKGEKRGGYASKNTFIRYSIYLAYYCQTTGAFCKDKSKKSANIQQSLNADSIYARAIEQGKTEEEAKALVEFFASVA